MDQVMERIPEFIAIVIIVAINVWNRRDAIKIQKKAAQTEKKAQDALTATDEATVLLRQEANRLIEASETIRSLLGELEDRAILTQQVQRLQSELTAKALTLAELHHVMAFVRSSPEASDAVDAYFESKRVQAHGE